MDYPKYESEKFGELILYIAKRCASDPRCGATKLNKILFYADFRSYGLFQKPVTGAVYQHLGNGPAPRQLLPALRKLRASKSVEVLTTTYFGKTQKRIVAKREADLSLFKAEEIALVEEVIRELWEHTGKQVSNLSHETAGWRTTALSADIPYQTVFVSKREPSSKDIQFGKKLAEQNNWL